MTYDARESPQLGLAGLRSPDRPTRLETLGQLRDSPETRAAVRAIAEDRADDPLVRAASIVFLARQGELVEAERDSPGPVSLAHRRGAELVAARRLVAAYARGEETGQAPEAALLPAPMEGVQDIELITLPDEELVRAAAARGERPGRFHILGLRCAGKEFAVLGDRQVLAPERLLSTRARPAIIAVHHQEEVDHWTAPFDALTEPDEARSSVRISVVDDRGRVVYGGAGRPDGNGGLQFVIQAADRPGMAAVEVEGVVSTDGLRLLRAVSDTVVRNRRQLRPDAARRARGAGGGQG